ncbi:MAG: hypothetical protein V7765_15600 [Oleispira sp.]
MYKQYLKISLLTFSFLMLIVASVNFIIDPGEIYLKKILADSKSKEFSSKLFLSENGIIQSGWNERLIKTTLAKSAGDFDCIILGSSHMMQISSVRNTGKINSNCDGLLNLGVSGGGLEDISIFSYFIINNLKLPKKIFIGVDPFTFNFKIDARYGAHMAPYNKMNDLLGLLEAGENVSYLSKLAKNLFNGKYFYSSILALSDENIINKNDLFEQEIYYPNESFSYENGYSQPLTLKDGSHLYAQPWIENQRTLIVPRGGGGHLMADNVYNPNSVSYLKKLIDLYRSKNIDVHLIMTPYHPNVFKKGETKPVIHMRIVEEMITSFSDRHYIKYYGSFFPDKIGCLNDEFFDFMHATNECLGRIDFSQ